MITKADVKFLRSLSRKSIRDTHGLFIAEGHKAVSELIDSYACTLLIGTTEELSQLQSRHRAERIEEISLSFDFSRISSLENPRPVLAVFRSNYQQAPHINELKTPSLLLDGIQDPGNVGTIIRTANWFGVEHILLAPGTADVFSPKVIQACMGALAGINIHRLENPVSYLQEARKMGIPIIGTFLKAPSIYDIILPPVDSVAILVLGNEGRGISSQMDPLCDLRLHIPAGQRPQPHTESLNVAVATAIVLAHWHSPMRAESY